MKFLLQSEAAECGLASLAMVASAHGLHIGLPELRRRFPLSRRVGVGLESQPSGCDYDLERGVW